MLAMEELATIAGNRLTACFLLYQLAFASKNAALERALVAHLTAADLDSPRCLSAAARVLLLCEEMHLRFGLPVPWVGALEVAVRRGDGNLTEPQLRGLATYAVNSRLPKGATLSVSLAPLAYGLAGHGLRRPDADQARFLLVRGKSLLIEDALAPQRGLECLRAARMLAARRRDMTLVEEAMSLERRYGYLVRSFPFGDDHDADHLNLLSAEALERLLAAERQALEFPARQAPAAIPLRTPIRPAAPQSRDDRRQGYLPGLEVLDATADDSPLGPGPETDGLDIFRALEDLEAPDEPGDSDGEPFDDLPPELAPAILAAMSKLYLKYGNGALDLIQDLDRLARKEPQIFAELVTALEASTLGHAGASLPFPFPPRRRGRR
jgi:hypothetical protein